jgi:hypothetical protein
MAYKKAKGSVGIGGASKSNVPKTLKSKRTTEPGYCGIQDARPANKDRKQSAK